LTAAAPLPAGFAQDDDVLFKEQASFGARSSVARFDLHDRSTRHCRQVSSQFLNDLPSSRNGIGLHRVERIWS
jgi:hypothetical protein